MNELNNLLAPAAEQTEDQTIPQVPEQKEVVAVLSEGIEAGAAIEKLLHETVPEEKAGIKPEMQGELTGKDNEKGIVYLSDVCRALIGEPSAENAEAYIAKTQEYDAKWYYRENKRVFLQLLHNYAKSGNEHMLKALQEADVFFAGTESEDSLIDLIKFCIRQRSKANMGQVFRLFLSKCTDPKRAKRKAFFRLLKKPFVKIGGFFCRIGNYFRQQHLYKKYGYTKNTLHTWDRIRRQDAQLNAQKDPQLIKWAHKRGFLYARVRQYGLTEQNYRSYISDRDYILLNPINNSYSKWISDIPSLRYCVTNGTEYLPKLYFHVLRRAGKPVFVKLLDCPEGYGSGNVEEILRLIRTLGEVAFRPAAFSTSQKIYLISYRDDSYYLGKKETTEEHIRSILTTQRWHYVLQEKVDMDKDHASALGHRVVEYRAVIVNKNVFDPHITEFYIMQENGSPITVNLTDGSFQNCSIPGWESIRDQILSFCACIPQLEYYSLNLRMRDGRVYVMSCNLHPTLMKSVKPSRETTDFLLEKLKTRQNAKRRIFSAERVRSKCWDIFRHKFCEPGYRDFMLREYVNGVIDDFFHFRKTNLFQKLWCYKRGFYSFRLAQYNLTKDNWDKILSDRDYHWLCPINPVYQKWIDDKMTYRMVIEPFRHVAPKYYYQIINRNGTSYAIRMQDCPEQYGSNFEDIVRLLEDVGALALKQSAGEHGDGFFKISYSEGKYYINKDEVSREEILEKLRSLTRFYNVTEFLTMHDSLRHIYPGSVNTIRVMVLNPSGCDPYIANAYMRIGTGTTKMTDNIGYGGVFAKVDVDTGRYYGAERLQNHVIVPCPNHPDTGVLIEGYLPDWEQAKKDLIDICNHFGQLEYLGFDVALSSAGMRILEINKFQDLHRCAFYGDRVQAYFKEKILEKKQELNLTK